MTRKAHPLPLVFMLAMAAEASGASIPDGHENAQAFRPGDLVPLARRAAELPGNAPAPGRQPVYRPVPGERTVQYFPNFHNFPNFFNCFAGYWRNC
jgi:hypothetical protein